MENSSNVLNPAFVYIEEKMRETESMMANYLTDKIESLILDKFRNNPAMLTPQYISALKEVINLLEEVNAMAIKAKWHQDEKERQEIHNYLCAFKSENNDDQNCKVIT